MDQPGHPVLRNNQPGAADRMRELLARTVQDHVSDQQSTAGALEDILDILRAQDERLTRPQHTLDQLLQQMETAAGRVTALDARLERLDERLDDQYDRVSAIDHTLMAVDTKLGALDARLGSLEEAVLTLAEALLRPAARAASAAREGTRG
jgi:chromosome segregation ATPase